MIIYTWFLNSKGVGNIKTVFIVLQRRAKSISVTHKFPITFYVKSFFLQKKMSTKNSNFSTDSEEILQFIRKKKTFVV